MHTPDIHGVRTTTLLAWINPGCSLPPGPPAGQQAVLFQHSTNSSPLIKYGKHIAHGVLLLAAFCLIMPTAALLARHKWLFGADVRVRSQSHNDATHVVTPVVTPAVTPAVTPTLLSVTGQHRPRPGCWHITQQCLMSRFDQGKCWLRATLLVYHMSTRAHSESCLPVRPPTLPSTVCKHQHVLCCVGALAPLSPSGL